MKKNVVLILTLAVAAGACSGSDAREIRAGSEVTVEQKDGVTVAGRLVEITPEQVIVESRTGVKTTVPRTQIADLRAAALPDADGEKAAVAAEAGPSAAAEVEAAADPVPRYREVTLPVGTVLPLTLRTAIGSDTSHIEDPVRATLRRGVTVDGVEALPAGTAVTGHVTGAERSARVKGRASLAFRFTKVDPPGAGATTNIRTGTVSHQAAATKKKDAATIGGGAVGGAIVGGILGGGDGAAKGAVVGGAGGTGVVLATRGKEVRLAAGTPISVKLTAPLTVRVPVQ